MSQTRRIIAALILTAVLYGLNLVFAGYVNPYITQIVCMIGINIIMASSLNLINGQTGQFSIGHAGFMAIGAYASAAMTVYLRDDFIALTPFLPETASLGVFFMLALFAGGLLALVAGLLIGIPTLRLRGDYLAIATLGFAEIVRVVVLNLDVVGGARGFTDIPEYADFFWIYLVAAGTVLVVRNLSRSVKGSALRAIREDELAAESVGIPTARYKVIAFAVGAFLAGVGGGLFAHLMTYLHTNTFTFLKSIEFIVMIVLGGLGSVTGAILGAIILTILPEALRAASELRMIAYSVLLIGIMLVAPQGILGNREWGFLKKK